MNRALHILGRHVLPWLLMGLCVVCFSTAGLLRGQPSGAWYLVWAFVFAILASVHVNTMRPQDR